MSDGAVAFQTNPNPVAFAYDSIEEAFPKVEPGRKAFGHNVLVQVRQPKARTSGGIILPDESRSTEHYNTRVAKVIELGPLCFTSTHTADFSDHENAVPRFVSVLTPWPEGPWFKAGDFVEIPQYGGVRFTMPVKIVRQEHDPGPDKMFPKTVTEEVTFAFFKSKDILGLLTCNPLQIKSFLD